MGKPAADADFSIEIVSEGAVKLKVPRMEDYLRPDGVYEPAWAPVFYNPRMGFNRDVAVVVAAAYKKYAGLDELHVVEPLAGSGVRAVRYAVEAGAEVFANDIDARAARLIAENARLNGVEGRVHVYNLDANEFMYALLRQRSRVDVVDIDPFGSPAPFVDAAIVLAGRSRGVIAATATDVAPLSGTYPRALRRRYGVDPARMLWDKEQAVRILSGYIIRRAAAYGYRAEVLLGYYADHYVRVYFRLEPGAKRADEALNQLAYGVSCGGCGYVGFSATKPTRCPYCQSPLTYVGPLYRGPLCDREFVKLAAEHAAKLKDRLQEGARVVKLLSLVEEECTITRPYYRVDKVCSILKVNMPSPARVAEALNSLGYRSARTHFDTRGVKTEAPHPLFIKTLLEISPG